MTDFNELELEEDVADMSGDEAKETLVDFMEAHRKNREVYDSTVTEFKDKIDDVQAQKNEIEETLGELKTEYAEEAAKHVNMPAELLEKRFDFTEIRQILEDAAEFAESQEGEEEDTGLPLTDFADREQKGETGGGDEGGDGYGFRDEAAEHLKRHGINVGE